MTSPLARYRQHPMALPFLIAFTVHLLLVLIAMVIRLETRPMEAKRQTYHLKAGKGSMPGRKGAGVVRKRVEDLQIVRQAGRTNREAKDVSVRDILKETRAGEPRDETFKGVSADEAKPAGRAIEDILTATEERQVKEKIKVPSQSTAGAATAVDKLRASRGVLDGAKLLESLKKPLGILGGMGSVARNVSVDPDEGMPGFTPSVGDTMNPGLERGLGEARGDITQYEALDEFLDIDVYTHEDSSDGKKYFMIKIFARPDVDVFHVMPKEILFTIDCSLSISPDRLEEFKNGIRYCLTHLNEDDVFNIVAFRENAFFFAPSPVKATPETIKRAERFVAGLTSTQRTDMFSAINKIVKTPLTRHPSSIMLITDGRPTHGVVDARDLLSAITKANQKVRPIFAFSGGGKVNRYLLDFIAYQNRAWSQYTKRTADIDKGMANFYGKIKDPIFINLRYRLNGIPEKDAYPRSLPDFYQGAEFTLYGTYADEDLFSMQLLGDVEGQTKELVFSRSLSEAPKGNADLMKGYAFNKIYHLISRVSAEGSTPELRREIEALSKRYGITTPYSPELEKMD